MASITKGISKRERRKAKEAVRQVQQDDYPEFAGLGRLALIKLVKYYRESLLSLEERVEDVCEELKARRVTFSRWDTEHDDDLSSR